jgi:hypothetical protein
MPNSNIPRVTFDTNVCNVIYNPQKWPKNVAPIEAFISEASIFVECLSFEDKLTYLAVAGTDRERPKPRPEFVERFRYIQQIGAKLLHAPLLGSETFIDDFEWAEDRNFSAADRLSRFNGFCRPLDGLSKLRELGRKLDEQHPATFAGTPMSGPTAWRTVFKRVWDLNPDNRKSLERKWKPFFSEWTDGTILGSHHAYGNEVFCTMDEGKDAGPGSLLHPDGRAALAQRNIVIMSPKDLVQRYGF